jgi:two-component sensor histidine kinase
MLLPVRVLILLLMFLAAAFSSRAEAIQPLLPRASFESLLNQLRHSRPDIGRVQLLLQIGQDVLAQHDETGLDIAPAVAYCRRAAALSDSLHYPAGRIGSLYLQGQIQGIRDLTSEGQTLYRQGISLSQRVAHRRLEAFGWFYLSESYWHDLATLPTQLAYFQRARTLFHQVGDRVNEAYVLKCMADIHQLQGHPEQAIRELLEVEALYRAAGHRQLHYTYDLLTATYRQMGDYKEALRYGLMAVESAQATQDTSNIIGGLYNRLGVLYRELKQYPASLAYYRKALENFQHLGQTLNVISVAGVMARIMVAQHRAPEALAFFTQVTKPYATDEPRVVERIADYMVEMHAALGHYALAEQYTAQMVAYAKSPPADNGEKSSIYHTLGKFYLLTKRYDQARYYLTQALNLERHDSPLLRGAELHLLLFKADSAQEQFPAAIAHYQRYKLLTDSVFNERKNKQLASLEIQYDTRKKEQNIALLTKQTQVQQASLQQQEFQRNALVVGALLLAGLLLLGYNRYRLKQRAAQLLEAQQGEINRQNLSLQHLLTEKDWMLKEIHHRVKNNLEVISSLLETQADYLHDPAALTALREGQNRVHAMALIHQKLYQADNLAVVDMAAYIREITEHLLESFDCQDTVRMHLAVAPVELDVTLATPLGLIINEALTNALKYAFPGRQPGTVRMELAETGPRQYQLSIADDGVGFPPGFNLESGTTMGLTIMRGLSGQLDGYLRISQNAGVQVSLDFEAAPAPHLSA